MKNEDLGDTSSKAPIALDLTPGTYWWCACKRSGNQPFCDGSHKGCGIQPIKFEVSEAKKYYLCNCKETGNAPFCDGSHKQA